MNCKKHNHKLKTLFKLSQVQMRLFPHKGVSSKPQDIFVNIVDEETAICSVCGENTPFVEEYADKGPLAYDKDSEYVYSDLSKLDQHGVRTKIQIDPTPVEEWSPQNQEEHKVSTVAKITKLADSLKKIGSSIYTGVLEKPIELVINFDYEGLEGISLKNSLITVQYDGRINNIGSSSIISWVVTKNDGTTEDVLQKLRDKIATSYIHHIERYFVIQINVGLEDTINSRFLKLIKEYDAESLIMTYEELLPFIVGRLSYNTSLLLRAISEIVRSPPARMSLSAAIFSQNKYLEAYDDLNSVAREISEINYPLTTREDIDTVKLSPFKDDYLAPICLECAENIFEKCTDCNSYNFEDQISSFHGNRICSSCMDDWSSCDDCGDMVRSEDMHYNEEEGESYCEDCYPKHARTAIDTDDFDDPHDLASQEPIFLSGNKQNLEKLMSAIEGLWSKTKGGPPLKLKQDFINIFKANGIKEDEAKIIINTLDSSDTIWETAGLIGESDFKNYLEKYVAAIKNYISHQENFYSKYPLAIDQSTRTENIYSGKKIEILKNYQPMPVKYEYAEAHRGSSSSFVIKMMPADTLLDQAEVLFPGLGKESWKYFSKAGTQHYPGCIAYARISYDGDNLVIDNLQRDADLNNARPDEYKARFSDPAKAEMAEKALRWWDKRTSKWYVQFTDYLINFAKNNSKKLYLTNFDTQKRKWTRIPDRNAEVYDNLPEELSSAALYKKLQEMKVENPSETIESLKEKINNGEVTVYPTLDKTPDPNLQIEDLRGPINGIWRLAKKYEILKIFKKANKIKK
jgi:hypothetical protein